MAIRQQAIGSPKYLPDEFLLDKVVSGEEIDPGCLVAYIEANATEPFPTLDAIGYLREWLDEIEHQLMVKARMEDVGWQKIADAIDRSRDEAQTQVRSITPTRTCRHRRESPEAHGFIAVVAHTFAPTS